MTGVCRRRWARRSSLRWPFPSGVTTSRFVLHFCFGCTHPRVLIRAKSPIPAITNGELGLLNHLDLVNADVASDWAKPHQSVTRVDLGLVRKLSLVIQKKTSQCLTWSMSMWQLTRTRTYLSLCVARYHLGTKCLSSQKQIPRKYKKIPESCKIHVYFIFNQKNANNISKWSKKYLSICIINFHTLV
jgi:hypothetical protein